MIFIQITEQLQSLKNLLLQLNDQQYNRQIEFLGNATIGGHTRHIIELLKCAMDGYRTGTVDYLNRVRNLAIETDKKIALHELSCMAELVVQPNRQLNLVVESCEESTGNDVATTYFREIVYNTEHAIHHLALIRVALREMQLDIVADSFGMAYSTLKYLAGQPETNN